MISTTTLLICLHCDAKVPRRDDEHCSACGEAYSEPTNHQIDDLASDVLRRIESVIRTTRWMADEGYDARSVALCVEKPWRYRREWLLAEQESHNTEVPT